MRSTLATVLIFALIQSLDCLTEPSNSRLNYFDIDLLRYVAEGKTGNVMVSPASIKSTLAMLLEGAQGVTAAEIQTALRLNTNKEDYRKQLATFMKDLQVNSSGVFVQNANGLFVTKKLQLNKEYKKMAKELYFSEVNNVDFNDPRTSADIINGWVSSKTKGLIPDIIDQAQITPQTELIVTNALYFKGIWQHEFEPKLTHADCFYRNGVCKNVAMMELDAELNYAHVENLRAHALELPYQGKRHSMILVVPQDRDAEVALIRDLPYIGLLQISKLLEPTDVILTMPKFTVEYGDDLVAALKNMRINSLFSTSANLSGIFDDPKASGLVNRIYHKVYMQVDEKGTVAAAASAGMVVPLINNYVNLRIDRPFLFFIWDNEKGVVLFEGRIEEPTEFTELNNKFSTNNNDNNNGQKPVSSEPYPKPIQDKLTPDGPQNTQSMPIYQLYTTRPLTDQKNFMNNGQENDNHEPFVKPIEVQLTPDGPKMSYSIPIQQFYPIQTISDQKNLSNNDQENLKHKPISYPTGDHWTPEPYNKAIPNQQHVPIQPIVSRPVSSQPNQGTSQPNQGTSQPNQGMNHPNHGTSQPYQGTSYLNQGTSQPYQGTSQPNQGTSYPNQGTSQPISGQPIHSQPLPPSDHLLPPPSDHLLPPNDQPIPPTNQPISVPPKTESQTTKPPIVKSAPWYEKVANYLG